MPYNKTLVVVASFLGWRNCLTHFFADSVFRPIFRLLLCRSLSVYCRSHAGYGSSKAIGMAMLTFCLERNSWEWIYEEKLCSTYFKSSNCLILIFSSYMKAQMSLNTTLSGLGLLICIINRLN